LRQKAGKKRGSEVKPHYFGQDKADTDDTFLQMSIHQGYVPVTCLLGGNVVWSLINEGKDPCIGCPCDRAKCNGRSERPELADEYYTKHKPAHIRSKSRQEKEE